MTDLSKIKQIHANYMEGRDYWCDIDRDCWLEFAIWYARREREACVKICEERAGNNLSNRSDEDLKIANMIRVRANED